MVLWMGYCLWWIMSVPFFFLVLIKGGWEMYYSFTGLDGLTGQLSFWAATILNPVTLVIVASLIMIRIPRRKFGGKNVEF